MRYATYNLRVIADGYLDGPESTIVARGGSAKAIWTSGQVETGATILGEVSGDLSDLTSWNLVEISRQEARLFIEANFTPYTDSDGKFYSLENALQVLG